MTAAVKHSTYRPLVYGADRYYLEETIVGGTTNAHVPTVALPTDATNPPCAAEIASISRTSTGLYVVTLYDAYYAVAFASAQIDDSAAAGYYATIGNWTNLQTATPAVFSVYCWSSAGNAQELASGVALRLNIAFKKNATGNAS